jgi:hypothetical protein
MQSDQVSPVYIRVYQGGVKIYDESDGTDVAINKPSITGQQEELYVLVQDANGNIPPSGTSMTISGEGYEIFGSTGIVTNAINEVGTTVAAANINNEFEFGMLRRVVYLDDGTEESIKVTISVNGRAQEVVLN